MEGIANRLLLIIGIVVALAMLTGFADRAAGADVTYERLLNADKEPNNWLMYYGSYKAWRYSLLKQITTTNVKRLVVKWAFSTGPDEGSQVTPLVVDGVMYLTNDKNHVFALDAATGKMLWRYTYELPDWGKMPWRIYGRISRGVSIANGKVLMGTQDAHLVALDAKTGKLLWKVQVGNWEDGHGFTAPPLIVKDKAIIGFVTFHFPGRAFIDAYDIETGKMRWRFYTIPGPGEPGNETWGPGDAWQHGGAAAWQPGTYDPELNLVYLGTGEPGPMFDGGVRPGDNLYSDSIVALDADTGQLKWYFQTTPHDVWDYDASPGEPVLVDTEIQGRPVKALLHANKNGYFYALDRTNGRFLYAKPFVSRTNWTKGLDEKGRPIVDVVPTPEGGVAICPSAWGAKSFAQMAYHPQTGYVYIPAIDLCAEPKVIRMKPRSGVMYAGGDFGLDKPDPGAHGQLVAIDVKTGETKWQHRSKYPMVASVLTTAGGLVFTGDIEANALAFDASNGELLWTFSTGASIRGSTVTYGVNGKQYIAVASGLSSTMGGALPLSIPELKNLPLLSSTIFVFGLFEE